MNRDLRTDAEPLSGERGQTMVEYAVVLSVITVAILTTIVLIGDSAGGLIDKVAQFLS
jgi:Flp pilus assembly pilin Flp